MTAEDRDRIRALLDERVPAEELLREVGALRDVERREARALAAIARAAQALPRPEPAPEFTERAMARVRARPPPTPPRRGLLGWLLAPRLSPLGALAGAAAAAFLALAVSRVPQPAEPAPAPRPAERVMARLVLSAPDARDVRVAGDFNGWRPEATPLTRGEDGRWRVEVPVTPGRRYQYMFVVDGDWVTDPSAPRRADDGFGGENAVLDL